MTIGARARIGCLIPGLLHNTKIYRRYQPALREPDTLAARLRDGLDLARGRSASLTDTSRQHRRCSCLHLPLGRLRYAIGSPATLAPKPTLS